MPQRPLDPEGTSVITVRLPTKVADRLKSEAQRTGESLSSVLRRLLDATTPQATAKPETYTHQGATKTKAAPAEATTAEDMALAAATFPEKGRLKIENAIRLYKARLAKEFMAHVSAEAQRVIAESNDYVRKRLKEVEQKNATLERLLQQSREQNLFTKAEFRHLQMAVHPDNTASAEVRNKLIDMLVRNEHRLVKADPKPKPKKK